MSDIKFDSEIFRKRMKQCRLLADMTLEELAQKVGVSRPTLSKYEKGTIGSVEYSRVEQIAFAIGVSPDYLLGLTDNPQQTDDDREYNDILYSMPPPKDMPFDVLGRSFALLAYDKTIQLIVLELGKMNEEQRDLALKVIKGMNT